MTSVLFYVNVSDRLHFLYKLLSRKMMPRGLRVYIAANDDAEAARINQYLWTAEADGFLPHGLLAEEVAAESPVLIGVHEPADDFHADALVWWRGESPSFLGRFGYLIEIVSQKTRDKEQARERYKFYQSHGYQISVHQINSAQDARH